MEEPLGNAAGQIRIPATLIKTAGHFPKVTIACAFVFALDKVVYAPSGRPFMVAGHKLDEKTNQVVPEGKPIMQFFSCSISADFVFRFNRV